MNNYSRVPRGFIYIAQYLGIFMAVMMFGMAFYFFNKHTNSTPSYVVTSGIGLAIITYFAWKSIYAGVWIIIFVKNNTDEVISDNRFIISALSLSLGGIFTPFIMASMPNEEVKSSINPRYTIAKVMGPIALIGSVIAIGSFFIFTMTGASKIAFADIFNKTVVGVGPLILMIFLGLMFVIGLITSIFFLPKNTQQEFNDHDSAKAKIMNGISIVWLVIITLELIGVLIMAIIRLIGAIMDIFYAASNNSGAWKVFAIFAALARLSMTLLYVTYIFQITIATMRGIWAKDGVHMLKYERLAHKQQENLNAR
ncbi:hypothetical protein ELUMI_v1c05920 [Williamsoniiplasma luminosum]|uniref:Uncharacterized protein n=1 Tax=Williamsoniiplasma luminosum TaxID=214888 RepID=A0A2K8NU74_9MOLU|nr:hypothetical protein [Williamsoniiplasma luminosum]ATZ17314.1 hypothetical protein ELUMI_v1c05920 [Williamsoniiplasma luminosum]